MKLDKYQEFTATTDRSPKTFWYYGLGLAGEAGEVADKIKKAYRLSHQNNEPVKPERVGLLLEMSDVLWYLTRLCSMEGITLEELADLNHQKLTDRAARGVLVGEGDNR